MHPRTLLLVLLPLAGCAGSLEKTAESPPIPAVAMPQPPAAVPVPGVAPAEPARQAGSAPAVRLARSEVALPGGWDALSQRMLAWGDPLRRSMEQYCSPEDHHAQSLRRYRP